MEVLESLGKVLDFFVSQRVGTLVSPAAVCVKVFQVCGQPSLGMRSRRAANRRNQGEGRESRRRGQGEGRRRGDRGRRRRRTTPSFMDHIGDVDVDNDGMVQRRTHVPQTTTSKISSSTVPQPWTLDPAAASLGVNVTFLGNESLVGEEGFSTLMTTTVPMYSTSTGLPSTTDSIPRRTRRPRRNRNRGSRRRKNRRPSTPAMSMTTERAFYPDPDQHPLWGIEQHRQQHREGGSGSRLERMMADVRRKLTMNRDLVTQMPRSLCSMMTSAGVNERRCWNGTTYSRCVL